MIAAGELFAGRYRLGETSPSVAFVESYSAVDQTLNRPVVVTIVTERFSRNPAFAAEFLRHAQATLPLVHASIARTYDVGTDPISGRVFTVAEHVSGQSLHATLKSRALTVSEAAEVLTQVGDALDFSSQRGVHHLGLSPRDIWITPTGRAKVSGFGLFSLAASTAPSADLLASTVRGSGYFSPEHIHGKPLGESADVYALGLILSEALCRRPTWDRNLTGESLLLRASARPVLPGSVLSGIPPGIDALIENATEPDPTARLQTCRAFVSALAPFLPVQEPVVSLPLVVPSSREAANTATPSVAPAATAGTMAAPGIDPALAEVFPPDVLSTQPFTSSEFNAGRSRGRFVASLFSAVGVVLAISLGILWLVSALPANVIPSTSRPVPSVVGNSYDEAAKQIAAVGLRALRSDVVDGTVAVGNVVSVSPPAGTKIEIGSTVTVKVSSGGQSAAVPNLTGIAISAAQALLAKNGFTVGTIVPANGGTALKDTVLSSSPVAGELVPVGSIINLTISNGKVSIPNLVGKTVTEATATLTGPLIGITPSLVASTTCAASSPTTVKSQSVAPGDVAAGTKITLTYCSGP